MKYTKLLLPALAAFVLFACSNKQQASQAAEAVEVEETAVTPSVLLEPANADTVITVTDPLNLAPGVKVERLTVVDFNAVWCGPCRQLAPVMEDAAKKYAGKADFYSVDVDKYGELMLAYDLGQSIPVVLLLRPDGTQIHYVGTGDLLPADKFYDIIERNL